ncbi:beta-1,3-galactosyltransferase 5-like [Nilaparvata lugens]|uniref:beta-1,3-galactosyltransferase 5-like n=1 Tax=Nilaparvata lugens TaxID=108931 RepID=UPI00193DA49D|nr:beta-1,3-galactosyltransferase 5-like [Nilaparvata lugens]XP_039286197.1 beta-1,3-galactosyltransferase 5-like [Nilaparvata lugens]XP_039286199.1 beta-1,3-galactosyltransferase 5-like [Nilaparvata lugens]
MLEAHHHHQYQYRPLVICLLAGLSFITVCRLRMGTSVAAPDEAETWGGAMGRPEVVGPVVGPYQPLTASNVSTPMPFDVAEGGLGFADRSQLIDLGNFSFLMNDAAVNLCHPNATPPSLVTLVHSSPAHQHHRDAIRQVWGGKQMNVVFLVGEPSAAAVDNVTQLQQQLEAENELHGDLVQGSFQDTYRNLTYKHVMGLKWIAYHCPRARYVVKTDDDVFVNTRNLQRFLNDRLSPLGVRRLIMCQLWEGSLVKRSYRSKWRVSPEEYAGRTYPGYCPGWAVIYSPDVVQLLYREAQRTPFFWIDDVHVTGTLVAAANLTHTPLGAEPYLWTDDRDVMRRHHNSFLFYLMDQQQFKDLHDVQHSLPFS